MPRITEDPWEVLRREIDRSRRGGHAATLLRVALDAPGRGRRGRRAVSGGIARLADNLRSVDTVWADGDVVYALLPETSQDAAEALVSRLWREAPDVLPYEGL